MKFYHCIEDDYLKLEIDGATFKRPSSMIRALFAFADRMGVDIKNAFPDFYDDPKYMCTFIDRCGTKDHRYVEEWQDVADEKYIAYAIGWDDSGLSDDYEPVVNYGFLNICIRPGDDSMRCYYHGPDIIDDNRPKGWIDDRI